MDQNTIRRNFLNSARIAPTNGGQNNNASIESFYKQKFNALSGDPKAQYDVIAEYYDAIDPTKNKASTDFSTLLMGGGAPTSPAPFMGGLNAPLPVEIPDTAGDTSPVLPVEEEGQFGFGTGKGNLFGEGGLVANISQPFRQGLINPAANLIQTGAKTAADVLSGKPLMADDNLRQKQEIANRLLNEATQIADPVERAARTKAITDQARAEGLFTGQVTALGNTNNAVENQGSLLVSEQENANYMANPLVGGIKSGVGIASTAAPVGGGWARTLLGGTIGGAGQGFSASAPGEELNDTLAGGSTGFLTAGVLKGGGNAFNKVLNRGAAKVPASGLYTNLADDAIKMSKTGNKVGNALLGLADNQEIGAFNRNIGKKAPKGVGGQNLVREMKPLGLLKATNADELAELSTEIITTQGSKIRPALQQVDSTITVDDFIKPLKNALDDKMTLASDKGVTQRVVDDVKSVFENFGGTLTPEQAYNLKQTLGVKSHFDSTVDNATREAYKKVYFNANDIIDDLLKKNGFGEFRTINKQVSTATKALEYAQDAQKTVMAGRPVSLLDQGAMIMGGGLGGVPGAAVAYGASKVAQSPRVENALVSAIRGAGNKINSAKVPSIPNTAGLGTAGKVAQGILPRVVASQFTQTPQNPMSTNSSLPAGEEELDSTILGDSEINGVNVETLRQQLLARVISGEIDPSQATAANTLLNSISPKLTAVQKNKRDTVKAAGGIIDELKKSFDALGESQGGLLSRVGGSLRTTAGNVGLDDNAKVYNDMRESFATQMSSLLGEVGVKTDQDIKRAIGLIPEIGSTPGEAKQKWNQIYSLLKNIQDSVTEEGK